VAATLPFKKKFYFFKNHANFSNFFLLWSLVEKDSNDFLVQSQPVTTSLPFKNYYFLNQEKFFKSMYFVLVLALHFLMPYKIDSMVRKHLINH
jgi:hypothetical protein